MYVAISLFLNEYNFWSKKLWGEFVEETCKNILFARYEWLWAALYFQLTSEAFSTQHQFLPEYFPFYSQTRQHTDHSV